MGFNVQTALLSRHALFAATTVLLLALSSAKWPWAWLVSGAPLLSYSLLLGDAHGYHVLPAVPLWTLLATVNLGYALASTSWLFYWFYPAWCYPLLMVSCLFQFEAVARFARQRLRQLLRQIHTVHDKVALFDLPALQIDTEIDGLLVVRGLTLSFSSLTIVAHGVECGLFVDEGMEVSIQAAQVTVALFRFIQLGDVFVAFKGGRNVPSSNKQESDDSLDGTAENPLTGSQNPRPTSVKSGLEHIRELALDDDNAGKRYYEALHEIERTSDIHLSRERVKRLVSVTSEADESNSSSNSSSQSKSESYMLAAICSKLFDETSVSHAPPRSIKVTTLQKLLPPWVARLMSRLPMVLRFMLLMLSYFHPVRAASVTGAVSGQRIQDLLQEKVWKSYTEKNSVLEALEQRTSAWLSSALFVAELADINISAQVPFIPEYDIACRLAIADIKAYRTVLAESNLNEVIALGGADVSVAIPAFLLPDHEHLLPPPPSQRSIYEKMKALQQGGADGIQDTATDGGAHALHQATKDETCIKLSAHAHLPACFDSEVIEFLAAILKASKLIDIEKEGSQASDEEHEVSGFKEFARAVNSGVRDGVKRAALDAVVKDRWIAKLFSKVTKKLETARGDVGYSGEIPVALGPYRASAGGGMGGGTANLLP